MARIKIFLFVVSFLLGLAVSSCMGKSNDQNKTWCMVKVSAPDDKLQGFINFACSQLDCRGIQPGGSCYEPNTLQNHASYALDAYYQKNGVCNSDIGTPTVTDPSYGNCHYP